MTDDADGFKTVADGSLAAIGVSPEQAVSDLERLEELIWSRQPDEQAELEALHRRYLDADPPPKGERARVAYRLRLLFLGRWNSWSRLTRYRAWQGPQGETVEGTNNATPRAVGWWISLSLQYPVGSDGRPGASTGHGPGEDRLKPTSCR